jgi:predicted nucleic acid-binding protein
VIYCDSSLVVALFVPDVWAASARSLAAKFTDPIPLIPFGEVELVTRVHRAIGEKRLTGLEHASVLRQIDEDIADGIIVRKTPAAREHLEEALRLARRHAPVLAVRSLDILHVAAARLFKARKFASFDRRQRELAAAAGLRLLPADLP